MKYPDLTAHDSGGSPLVAAAELDKVIDEYHRSLDVFMRGNAEAFIALLSDRDDVTLGNPFGPFARGHDKVAETARLASSHMRDGKASGFERVVTHVGPDLAYIVEIERLGTKLDGAKQVSPYSLRVTTIFLPEHGTWKIIHRHADPITSARSWDSVVDKQP